MSDSRGNQDVSTPPQEGPRKAAPEEAAPPRVGAVIDIGSNSVRMVVAEVHADGRTEVLEHTQRPVRLGHSTFVTGRLNQKTMNATIAVLRDYRRILDTYAVEHLRAVATSAVREAGNRDAFVDRVAVATDLTVEVIEPAEESRLTVSAVRHALGDRHGINQDRTLVVDVGGGSALLTILEHGEIASSESYALGAIRLQEIMDTSGETPERAADLIRHQIDNIVAVIRRTHPLSDVKTFVAVGGDARFAAQHVGEPDAAGEFRVVSSKKLDHLVQACVRRSVEELAREHGLPFAAAETVTPALLSYQALLRATRAREMIISDVSMRDGLLLDLARYVTGREDPKIAESILHAAETIAEKYRYDADHAHQVADLAVRLFDELKAEHRLAPRYRLLLRVAAILHEVGGFVSSRAHHKHSYYLVSNAAIYGLRGDELQIVAHVGRYHRRSCPKPSHIDYMTLPREHRNTVNKLAAILRVADALDRGHAGQVRDFTIERNDDEFVIYVRGVVDLTLERRSLRRKGDLFRDIYGMQVRLEEDSASQADLRRARPVD